MATVSVDFNDLPIRQTYTIVAGDSLPLLLQLKVNGTAVNLSTCTLALDGTGPGGVAVTGRTITPSDAATGSFDGGLLSSETSAWVPGKARYEVECTFPIGHALFAAGAVKTLIQVELNVKADTA